MGAGVDIGVGEVVGDRYQVVRVIGEGGMGTVYEVTDLTTKRRRALKVMQASVVANAELRARFEREAVVAAEVVSDHIAEVFDAGVDASRGLPFIVLELLEGQELGDMIEPGLRLSPLDTVTFIGQASIALDKAHEVGIVHRDLKPENLFVTRRDDGSPRVKLLDFGIAKVTAGTMAGPQTKGILGTPLYMAPEQMHGEHQIGPAADTYALAHIAYRLLVGEAFWSREQQDAETIYRFLMGVMKGTDETASARAKSRNGVELPPAFDGWFARATAPDPKDRFATAGELSRTLGEIFDVPVPGFTERGSLAHITAPHPVTGTAPAMPLPQTSPGIPVDGSGDTLAQAPLIGGGTAPGGSLAGGAFTTPDEADDGDDGRRPPVALIGIGLVVAAGAVAFFVTRSMQDDGPGDDKQVVEPTKKKAEPAPKPAGEPTATAASGPPEPDLSGFWETEGTERPFEAKWSDGAFSFFIGDMNPYVRRNYQPNEPRFVLVPDGDGFLVEEHYRPNPPDDTRYGPSSSDSCVFVARADSAGHRLRATLAGGVLTVQHLQIAPTTDRYQVKDGVVTACTGFKDVPRKLRETKLARRK